MTPFKLPFPDAWVEDVEEAAEESFDPLELIPDELLLDKVPLDALPLALFTDGIADVPLDVPLGR